MQIMLLMSSLLIILFLYYFLYYYYEKATLLLILLPLVILLSYFLNVWIIGSAAAFIYDTYSKLPAMPVIRTFFSEEQQTAAKEHVKVMPHVFFNPIKMGKMWTKETLQHAYARVRKIWEYLNIIMVLLGLFALFVGIDLGFFLATALLAYLLWKRYSLWRRRRRRWQGGK